MILSKNGERYADVWFNGIGVMIPGGIFCHHRTQVVIGNENVTEQHYRDDSLTENDVPVSKHICNFADQYVLLLVLTTWCFITI